MKPLILFLFIFTACKSQSTYPTPAFTDSSLESLFTHIQDSITQVVAHDTRRHVIDSLKAIYEIQQATPVQEIKMATAKPQTGEKDTSTIFTGPQGGRYKWKLSRNGNYYKKYQ